MACFEPAITSCTSVGQLCGLLLLGLLLLAQATTARFAHSLTGGEQVGKLRKMSRVADPSAPPVTCQDLASCQIHEWYPALSKVSLKTKFVDLPKSFVDYLLSGTIFLRICFAMSGADIAFTDVRRRRPSQGFGAVFRQP